MTVLDPYPTSCQVAPGPNDLAEHTLYACPRWLHVLELGGRVPAAYLTNGPDGRHLGLLPLHHDAPTANVRYTVAHLTRGLDGYPADRAVSYCGPVSAYQTEVPTVRAAGPAAARDLIALADEHCRAVNRSLLVPYLTARAVRHLPADLGGRLVLEAFEAWFSTTAGGIDEYLSGIPRKRRHNVRRDRRAFREAGLTGGVEPLGACLEALAPLVVASARRHGQPGALVVASGHGHGQPGEVASLTAHLRAIADTFPADAVVFTARDPSDRLVGGVLGVFHRGELFLRMSGFATDVTRDAAAYFNLAYHLPLEYRRQRPHRRVHHGLGSLVTKHRHGAQLTPVWTLLPDPLPDPLAERANRQRTGALTQGLPASVVDSLWTDVVRTATRRAAS